MASSPWNDPIIHIDADDVVSLSDIFQSWGSWTELSSALSAVSAFNASLFSILKGQ